MSSHSNYGSVSPRGEDVESDHFEPLHNFNKDDDDDDDDDHEAHASIFGGAFSTFSQRVSDRLGPMYQNIMEENFTPLYRNFSEVGEALARPSFRLTERALDPLEDRRKMLKAAGKSSIPSEVANLSKNTIGGGVMSLSGGIALYASDPLAVISATTWILGLGFLFGYFCLLSGKACDMSLSATYRECWERTVGGSRGGILVAVATTLDPLMGLFANSAILSQSLKRTLEGVGIFFSIPTCLLMIAVGALLPLCLMKSLDALAPFSAFGMAAVFTALGCMMIRLVDGSYSEGGQFFDEIEPQYQPLFGTTSKAMSFYVMPFVCMAFTSFDMHYNCPRYYAELKDASIPRFTKVCASAFGIVSFLYLSIAVVGYLTFGKHSNSFILNNYSPNDSLATIARLSMGFSAMLTYPLNFMGLRDNFMDLLGLTDAFRGEMKMKVFTVLLLSTCILMACFVTDLGLISSIGGGTSVAMVAFVFPALMFRDAVRKHGDGSKGQKLEVGFVMISMIAMVMVGLIGVYASLTLGA